MSRHKYDVDELVTVDNGDAHRVYVVKRIYFGRPDPALPEVVYYDIEEPTPNGCGGLVSYAGINEERLRPATNVNPTDAYDRAMRGI